MGAYKNNTQSRINKETRIEFTQHKQLTETTKPDAITTYQALQQAIINTKQPSFKKRLHTISTQLINKIQTTHSQFTLTITNAAINDIHKAHKIAEQTLSKTTQHNTHRKKLRMQINEANLPTQQPPENQV